MPRWTTTRFSASGLILLGMAAPAIGGGTFTVNYRGNHLPAVTQRMNASGSIAGDFQYQVQTRAMRLEPGIGRIPLQVPTGSGQSLALGINDAGVCVGRVSPPAGGAAYGAIWGTDNTMTAMTMPPGTWSYSTASGINNSGSICGAATQAIAGPDPQQAWRWSSAGGYEMLPGIGGTDSLAWDINSSGAVVGRGNSAGGQYRAIVWDAEGTAWDMALPAGATQAYGLAINDAGRVVGTTQSNSDAWISSINGETTKLPDFGWKATANDINNSGWVVGWAETAPWEIIPVVWDPSGAVHNIATSVSASQFYFSGDFIFPITIGDNNWIAVRGYDFNAGGDPRVLIFEVGFVTPCPTDLDSDGLTGAADLAMLLAVWGSASGNPADFSGDGQVMADDLAVLLGAWGTCAP